MENGCGNGTPELKYFQPILLRPTFDGIQDHAAPHASPLAGALGLPNVRLLRRCASRISLAEHHRFLGGSVTTLTYSGETPSGLSSRPNLSRRRRHLPGPPR